MTTEISKRKVGIFTGNRAEYGLQYPILKAISADPRFDYYLLVSGAHLKDDFGRTLEEIEKDGFKIYSEVTLEMPDDSLLATSQAIGSGVLNLSAILADIEPDFLVVYADRFESFAAMITSTQMGIPTAHIEGGDYTEGGALDDSVRHAMTKLAHLHFTTNEQAALRVKNMGEENWRVFNVGFPALDLINDNNFASPEEVYDRFELDSAKPILIFTQHSVATEFENAATQVKPSLAALENAAVEWDCQVIVTYPNDDAGGRRIMAELEKLDDRNVTNIQVHRSLGRYYYHGVLNVAAACIGNSSSGIKETPVFKCPNIDIGKRQKGRLRGNNVITTEYDKEQIKAAIKRCLFDSEFKKVMENCENPYGAGGAGPKIADVLASVPIDSKLIQKKMTY